MKLKRDGAISFDEEGYVLNRMKAADGPPDSNDRDWMKCAILGSDCETRGIICMMVMMCQACVWWCSTRADARPFLAREQVDCIIAHLGYAEVFKVHCELCIEVHVEDKKFHLREFGHEASEVFLFTPAGAAKDAVVTRQLCKECERKLFLSSTRAK